MLKPVHIIADGTNEMHDGAINTDEIAAVEAVESDKMLISLQNGDHLTTTGKPADLIP